MLAFLRYKCIIIYPDKDTLTSISSDLFTISLTIAGFVLTLLTILITFKSSTTTNKDSNPEKESLFNLFFATNYYFETVKHLKNAVKSLLLISISGFFIKLLITPHALIALFYFSAFGLVIIAITLARSLIILSKIIQLQKDKHG